MDPNGEPAAGTRHLLQPNKEHRWLTGITKSGKQVLMGIDEGDMLSIRFNQAGSLIGIDERAGDSMQDLTQWAAEVIAKPSGIHITEFEIADRGIALRQFPAEYQDFLDTPWAYDVPERSRYAVIINEWKLRDRFVVVWHGEHWCCRDGLVHS